MRMWLTLFLTPFFDPRLFQLPLSLNCMVALCLQASLCTTMVPLYVVVRAPMVLIIALPVVICKANSM